MDEVFHYNTGGQPQRIKQITMKNIIKIRQFYNKRSHWNLKVKATLTSILKFFTIVENMHNQENIYNQEKVGRREV